MINHAVVDSGPVTPDASLQGQYAQRGSDTRGGLAPFVLSLTTQ